MPRLALSAGVTERPHSISINSDEAVAAIAAGSSVYLHKLPGGELINQIDREHFGLEAAFDASDNLVIFDREAVVFFDMKRFELTKEITVPSQLAGDKNPYALSADRQTVYATGLRAGRPTIWEIETAKQRPRIKYTHRSEDTAEEARITHISVADTADTAFIKFSDGQGYLLKTGARWVTALNIPEADTYKAIRPDGNLIRFDLIENKLTNIALYDPVTKSVQKNIPVEPTYFPKLSKFVTTPGASRYMIGHYSLSLLTIDFQEGTANITEHANSYLATGLYPESNHALIVYDNYEKGYITEKIDFRTASVLQTFDSQSFQADHIIGHPDKNIIYVEDKGKGIKKIEIGDEQIRIEQYSSMLDYKPTRFVAKDESLISVTNPVVNSYRELIFQPLSSDLKPSSQAIKIPPQLHKGSAYPISSLEISEDGVYILINESRGSRLIDRSGKIIWKSELKDGVVCGSIGKVIYPNAALDLKTGQIIWENQSPGDIVAINQNKNYLLKHRTLYGIGREVEGSEFYRIDLKTGNQISYDKLYHLKGYLRKSASTSEGDLLAIAYDKATRIYNTADLSVKAELQSKGSNAYNGIAFFNDAKFLAMLNFDHEVIFWDLEQEKQLAKMTLLQGKEDWLVSDVSGRFDAPIETQEKLNYAIGAALVPLEAYFDVYYRPRFLPDLLAGRQVQAATFDISQLSVPPKIKLAAVAGTKVLTSETENTISDHQLTLNLASHSPNAPVVEYRIFQNGKRVAANTRGLVVEDDILDANDNADDISYTNSRQVPVQLLPGTNSFRVVAVNVQGIESAPAELKVHFDAPANQKTTLHLLAVGINQYQNEKYNLNYAVPDANAFQERITEIGSPLFDQMAPRFIGDTQVTKAVLEKELAAIQAAAAPQDVFIFYYAGHGVVADQGRGDFYIVPTDVTQIYGADDQLAQRGLSSRQIQELSQAIPAQKQLFILDACHSAGALTGLSQRGAAEEKAIAQLARSTGTHWLTASGSQQFATEFAELGHGAFTYTLLQGISGKADSGDGRVTVNELKAYLESEVPVITSKYKGTAQYPASYGYGQDFPITLP
tara:strand:+ start:6729 stop:9935 length:3207 start_codon:yes stop_codon:yes gene_type:complete